MKIIFETREYNAIYVIKTEKFYNDKIYDCVTNTIIIDNDSIFSIEDGWADDAIIIVLEDYAYIYIDLLDNSHPHSYNYTPSLVKQTLNKLRKRMIIR